MALTREIRALHLEHNDLTIDKTCMCFRPPPSQVNRRRFLAGVATGVALAATSGCVGTNAASGRDSFIIFQSVEDDIAQGRANHPKILKAFGGAYDDQRLNSYVKGIGKRLTNQSEYQQYPYEFTILNSQI